MKGEEERQLLCCLFFTLRAATLQAEGGRLFLLRFFLLANDQDLDFGFDIVAEV